MIVVRHTLPLACLVAVALGALAVPPAAAAEVAPRVDISALSQRVGDCFGREDPECAEAAITALESQTSSSAAVAYTRGYQALLRGRFDDAAGILSSVAANPLAPRSLKGRATEFAALARATAAATAGFERHLIAGGRFEVWLQPGPDEVMLDGMARVLRLALPRLEAAFGPAPKRPIAIHLYPRVDLLARVSGLTSEQIHASGTIALCKYNRLMLTSPNDLVFGYPWADTLTHELVHFLIIKHGGDKVPIWLHEGLARSFESVWRGGSALTLDAEELKALTGARRRGRLIPFSRMSPTMAQLPSQEATQLAFAEVHHAVTWLLTRPQRSPPAPPGPVAPAPAAVLADEAAQATAAARRLVSLFGDGASEAAVLEAWLGVGPKAFAAAWRKALLKQTRHPPGVGAAGGSRRPLVFKRQASAKGPLAKLKGEARRFVELGDRLLALERPQAAVIEYRKALARGAEAGPILRARFARALLRLGKHDEAAVELAAALPEHPNHAPLLVLHSEALLAQGKARQALAAAEKAGWINPFDPGIHRVSRGAWLQLGDKEQAAAALLREKKLQP